MGTDTRPNVDPATVAGFGDEWQRFNHEGIDDEELHKSFDLYFAVFPWHTLPPNAVGFDLGCGSGRWARLVAPRVGTLHCIDASDAALGVAKRNLASQANVQFHHASVAEIPLSDGTMDFGYSLGVLHHVPDTAAGIAQCARLLKPGAPFLVYLYYALENRPLWYRAMFHATELARLAICKLPPTGRHIASDVIATTVWWPLARSARAAERLGVNVRQFPLATYRNLPFYQIRNDSLDRFGTPLAQRFTRDEVKQMMEQAGLVNVRFREGVPYWTAVGFKAR